MSLRQRHIDPQLAMGSQRLVESCLLAGQQGEGTPYLSRSRATLRQSRSQSFGQLECLSLPPLFSAVSHPSIICASSLSPQSLSSSSSPSSCSPCAVGAVVAPHSSHLFHASFQPMDPIPDFTSSDVSKAHSSYSDGFGYFSPFSTHTACAWVFFFFSPYLLSFHFLTNVSLHRFLRPYIIFFSLSPIFSSICFLKFLIFPVFVFLSQHCTWCGIMESLHSLFLSLCSRCSLPARLTSVEFQCPGCAQRVHGFAGIV